eukprot:TRINITY_DN3806_c0_g2_i1.p1 TRINITY_DN3806_c0_g2~~TRINITY_DN3806_c0_g2_i1.p1  ORF type:complete len:1047 (+),score=117.42 TRINITY_DN3806_c0_g2_i1:43-3183(+)
MAFTDASSGPRRVGLAITATLTASAAAATVVAFLKRRRRPNADNVDAGEQSSRGSRSGSNKGYYRAEVAQHCQVDDAWIIVKQEVYDVTEWLEEHPGGKFLLLAFAGRDATEPFETVAHSAIALRELRRLHKGFMMEGHASDIQPAPHPSREATLTGWQSIRPRMLTSEKVLERVDAAVWDVDEHGFMPSSDPVGIEALNDTVFKVFAELVDLLPALGLTGALRRELDDDVALQQRLRMCGDHGAVQSLTEAQCERAFAAVGYTMVAYWRGGTLQYSTGISSSDNHGASTSGGSCGASTEAIDTLPDFLAKPMLALSERLGRPPMPDYAATVLYNWARIDPAGPITPSNIRCALRLTGLLDEEWFFKTHVVIEAEAANVISAIIGALKSEDDDTLLDRLVALEESLWRVVRVCLPMMYERDSNGTPKCSENIFYQILRPLIKSGKLEFDGDVRTTHQLSGPSGAMSSLLPCVDAALGIETTSEKLKGALRSFELSMPREHRAFIAKLRGGPSIRQRILLSRPRAGEPHGAYDTAVRAFNRCIARVLDFRWSHWQYVKNFIMKPGNISFAVGSGGTSFDFLQQHITDTERAKLVEHSEAITKFASPAVPDYPSVLPPTVNTYPTLEFWSVDGQRGFLSRDPLIEPRKGAWAAFLPEDMRTALVVLWDIATRMPALVACDGPFYEHVVAAKEKLSPLQDEQIIFGMSEPAREFIMTTLCHIAAGCSVAGKGRPTPKIIDRPLKAVARSVGRPPLLNFTEIMLSNWAVTRLSENLTHQAEVTGEEREKAAPQLHVVWRFLASPDEEWYRGVHVLLHDEAREAVAAIRVGQVAMVDKNDQGVVGSMGRLLEWLNKWSDCFDAHFDQKDSRTEQVMIRRLEPFTIHSKDTTWEEMAAWIYCCGSSPILPALHAFMGIKMCATSDRAGSEIDRLGNLMRTLLEEMRMHMPRQHRAFLGELEKPGVNVRQYCFRRFGAKAVSVEKLHDLEVAYNDALNALVRFLARRMHLVNRFYPHLDGPFGTFHSDVEGMMRKNRLQLLEMRQRVSRCLEK